MTKTFIQWYLDSLCRHKPEWISVAGKVMICNHCQKLMVITPDLEARYKQYSTENEPGDK